MKYTKFVLMLHTNQLCFILITLYRGWVAGVKRLYIILCPGLCGHNTVFLLQMKFLLGITNAVSQTEFSRKLQLKGLCFCA